MIAMPLSRQRLELIVAWLIVYSYVKLK